MAKLSLTTAEFHAMLNAVADDIIANEPMLSEADRNLGDGDHGLGMQRGMLAAKEKLAALDLATTIDKQAQTMGMAMMSSMGGASGVIFGSFFIAGGKAMGPKDSFDSASLAALLKGACDGVMTRGKAKPGDKTMIDALHPAAEKALEVAGLSLPEAIVAVVEAGTAGRIASEALIATLGRAKTLGEGSIGFPDAGACSVVVILEAMRDSILA